MNREVCLNPWKRGGCASTDIAVTIFYKGKMLPICRQCWGKVAKSNREWFS